MRRRTHTRAARVARLLRYRLVVPLVRSVHPPEYTARGVAIGVFWGVSPFLGLQTFLMLATWQVSKRFFRKDASVIQALAWAWINNPLTMLPMYYAFYLTGLWLVGGEGARGYQAFGGLWESSRHAPTFLAGVQSIAQEIGWPLLIGSVPYAVAGSWVAYAWALRVVRARRRRISQAARAPAARHA